MPDNLWRPVATESCRRVLDARQPVAPCGALWRIGATESCQGSWMPDNLWQPGAPCGDGVLPLETTLLDAWMLGDSMPGGFEGMGPETSGLAWLA
jgi:hypothetical protein